MLDCWNSKKWKLKHFLSANEHNEKKSNTHSVTTSSVSVKIIAKKRSSLFCIQVKQHTDGLRNWNCTTF